MKHYRLALTVGCVLLAALAALATTEDYQQTVTGIQQSILSANWISIVLQFAGVATVFYLAFQMGAARQELNEVRKDLSDFSTRVTSLDQKVEGLGREVSAVSGQVSRLPGGRTAKWTGPV